MEFVSGFQVIKTALSGLMVLYCNKLRNFSNVLDIVKHMGLLEMQRFGDYLSLSLYQWGGQLGVQPYSLLLLVKVKQSHYRPEQAQRVLRKLRFPDFVTTPQDGGKVVSLTHWPPLPPGNTPGTHFC